MNIARSRGILIRAAIVLGVPAIWWTIAALIWRYLGTSSIYRTPFNLHNFFLFVGAAVDDVCGSIFAAFIMVALPTIVVLAVYQIIKWVFRGNLGNGKTN